MFKISFFTLCIFSLVAAFMFYFPSYLQYKGFDNGEIGLVMGIGSLISIFAQPFWGFVSDRMNTIKKVVAIILICSLLCSLLIFSVSTLAWVVVAMVLFMFFYSPSGPLTESMIVHYAYENRRSFGSIRLWGEIGAGTAALWIGFVLEYYGLPFMRWLYAGITIICLLALIRQSDARPHAVPVTLSSLGHLLSNRKFIILLGMILLLSIPNRINDTFITIYLKELGGSESSIGYAWFIATFCAVPTMAIMAKLLTRFNEMTFIITSGVFFTVRWFIYGISSEPWMLMVGQALHMLTFPIMLIPSIQLVMKIVPQELRATGQTLFTAIVFGIGGILGSWSGGMVLDYHSTDVLYLIGSLMSFVGTLLLFIFGRRFYT